MSTKKPKTLMINDIMTTFKNKFSSDISLEESENSVFEKLVAYVMTCKHSSDYDFSLQDICTGQSDSNGGSEMSIDSAAVLVNGLVVSSVDSLANIVLNAGEKVNVSYVFTQSKNKESFSDITAEYGKFLTGISTVLLAEAPKNNFTSGINSFIEIKNIVERGTVSTENGDKGITINGGINIYSYFVISGSEKSKTGDLAGALDHIETNNKNLENIGAYKINTPEIIGYETIRRVYDDAFIGAEAKFDWTTMSLFKMNNILKHGIDSIYTGYLPFKEYKKIIHDSDGNLRASIFTENVRGYLDSPINKSIKKSLAGDSGSESGSRGRDLFFAMNNGVTIIAKDVQAGQGTASTMKIEGYQIVNGCQTSNILHEYYTECLERLKNIKNGLPKEYVELDINDLSKRFTQDILKKKIEDDDDADAINEKIDEALECSKDIEDIESSICVPVRIIETKKDDAIDLIISSTNTQNSVNELVLLSRSDFNKGLEYYFKNSYGGVLRYERRKNQYINSAGSFNYKISMDDLLKSYASIYLKSPHESARYFGKLKKKATGSNPTIFSEKHNYDSYYLAARVYIDLDIWMRESKILSEYRRYRWHMMYAVAEIIDREAGRENKKANKILGKNMSFDQSAPKMKEVLDHYIKIHESENGAIINDIFSEARESIDKAIKTMQRRGVQLNEINKDAEFHKEIYKNIVK